jgi:brefeldin A-inhibited guanine nucleotide-exchange protein
MEVFITHTLSKIKKDCARKQGDLKDACAKVLDQIEAGHKYSNESHEYLVPLKMACDVKFHDYNFKIMEASLDCIQKLIAHGYLRGVKGPDSQKHVDELMDMICSCMDHSDEKVQLQMIKALLTAVTSPTFAVHETSLLTAMRTCYQIHLVSKSPINKMTAKATLTQMLNSVFQRMETYDEEKAAADAAKPAEAVAAEAAAAEAAAAAAAEAGGGDVSPTPPKPAAFPSVWHKDAYLLFCALCKQSMKGMADDPNVPLDPIALQSKTLSLELLLSVLDDPGTSFCSGQKFILAIRKYLCHSLVKNCTSNVTQMVQLSLKIFVVLIAHFKEHLRPQIGFFISEIFLRILESPNSTYNHKILVLEVFQNLSRDVQALVEIFLNYDCDFESADLFKRILQALAKVAMAQGQGERAERAGNNPEQDEEDMELQRLAVESIIGILRSLGANEQQGTGNAQGQPAAVESGDKGGEDDPEDAVATPVTPSNGSSSAVSAFDAKTQLKDTIEAAILKFNMKPIDGIKHLVKRGYMELTPEDTAKFLDEYRTKLSMTTIGEYLGNPEDYKDGFAFRTMHSYADRLDFTNLGLDEAIRYYLSGFRLPGEAQKIDRIMEKFAQRYCACNPDVFSCADTTFIISFSIIMLNTDLFNPSIKDEKKMTKTQFLSMNRGIDQSGKDIPPEILGGIYDRIKANRVPITHSFSY